MLKSVMAAGAVTGALLVPSIAMACDGGKVLYEDKFEKMNPAWGITLDPKIDKIDPTGYVADFAPNNYRLGISQLSFYDNYVACATFTVKFTCTNPSQCEAQPYVGLVVLAADRQNYYTFEASPAYSTYSLNRVQKNKWLTPVGWTAAPDGLKLASGKKFELQVTVKGGNMKLKLDGKELLEFDGVAPDGGSLAGFEIGTFSSDTTNSQFNVSNFTIKELPQ